MNPEIIEDEGAVLTQRTRDFLERFDAGAYGLAAPFVEELGVWVRPSQRIDVPKKDHQELRKLLKGGLLQVQVVRLALALLQLSMRLRPRVAGGWLETGRENTIDSDGGPQAPKTKPDWTLTTHFPP